MNALALGVYVWSTQERVHVVIQAGPGQFVARVGRDVLVLRRPTRGGRLGLYAGPDESIQVKPTGQAPMPTVTGPLALLGSMLRLAGPGPGWQDIQLVPGPSGDPACPSMCSGLSGAGFSPQRHVRAGADGGRAVLLSETPSRRYTLDADLLRGEGAQGLLVDVNRNGHGYLLLIRMDRPDASWLEWSHGRPGRLLKRQALNHLDVLSMLQRTLRLLLASVLVAQALVGLAIALFGAGLVMSWALRRMTRSWKRRFPRRFVQTWQADAAALVLAASGGALAAAVASRVFDDVPHGVDSVAYLFQARIFALGRLWVQAPALPSFFAEIHLLAYHGRWFTHDTPGWPLLLAGGAAAGDPWLVNPALAAGTMLLLYLTGREIYGRPTALLATAILLTSPFFLFLGGSLMSHASTLFFLTGFTYILVRSRRIERSGSTGGGGARRWGQLALAGGLLGMAFITRQLDTLAFALPLALLVPRQLRSATALVLGAAGPVLFMFLYNWQLSGAWRINLYTLQWSFDRPGFGPDVGPSGFTPAQGLWNTSYRLEMLHAHLFGWPFYTALAVILVPFVIGRANRWDALLGSSAMCVMAAYVAFWWPGISYGPRYWSAAIPPFALLAARGLVELYRLPLRVGLRPDRLAALLPPAALAVIFAVYNLTVYLPAQLPLYRTYDYMSAGPVHAVQRAGLHRALVFVVSRPQRWSYGEVFPGNSPLLNGDVIYARDRGRMDRALMKRYPDRTYYRLDDTTLTRLVLPQLPAAQAALSASRSERRHHVTPL